jgi:serine protease Do
VVSIVISKDLSKLPGYGIDRFGNDLFSPLFGFGVPTENQAQPNIQKVGAGSGFFVSTDGLILTNKHVVSDTAASYTVITNDGNSYDAKVLSVDPVNDLAIVKISISGAPTLVLSDSKTVQIGQRVVAIGNSLGQYQNTVTTGIVSGIGRSITAGNNRGLAEQLEGVIQTDAAINPGNSGGPLLNLAGQVVGINTAVDQEGQSVGFAIPSSDVSRALASFNKNGKITRPYLGVRYITLNKAIAAEEKLPKDYGALIVRGDARTDFAVLPGSPADKAGLVENDIILEVDGVKITQDMSLSRILKTHNVGDVLRLKVYDKGTEKEVTVTLEEMK